MAQRKPMLDFISEGDWRLADERQRLLAPLAESENGSVEDVDRVARLLKLSRASVTGFCVSSDNTSSPLPCCPARQAVRPGALFCRSHKRRSCSRQLRSSISPRNAHRSPPFIERFA